VKGQVRDAERSLRSYFRVAIIRAVSKARTDAARWCAGRSNKYWLIPGVFPKSKGHRSERTSRQSSLSNVCPLLFCVFVCVSVRVSVANFYTFCSTSFPCAASSDAILPSDQRRLGACILKGRPHGDEKAREDDGSHRGEVCCVER
jgi:hypothetical protein